MRRSYPAPRAQRSELGPATESSGDLHSELGEVRLLGTIELNKHPIATCIRHAAEEIELRPSALGRRVQVQIAKVVRPDCHAMAHLAVCRLQVGDRLTM